MKIKQAPSPYQGITLKITIKKKMVMMLNVQQTVWQTW